MQSAHSVHHMQDVQESQAVPQPRSAGVRLLTATDVMRLLGVDRSTVYRMAEDGRLRAMKVGRQWRFPAEPIEQLLASSVASAVMPSATPAPLPLDPAETEPLLALAAPSLGVMMIITDLEGRPLTPLFNPCPWFQERADDPALLEACAAEWRTLANDLDFTPVFRTGALGFECARAFIRSGSALVGMVLAGGVAPEGSDVPGLFLLTPDRRQQVLTTLPKVASALSRVTAHGGPDPDHPRR